MWTVSNKMTLPIALAQRLIAIVILKVWREVRGPVMFRNIIPTVENSTK